MRNTSEEIHHSENPDGSPSCNCDRPTESQQLLQTLLTEFRQYRTRRRWFRLVGVFAFIGVLGGSIALSWLDAPNQPDRFTAVIEISGVIGFDNDNSAAGLEERFQAAFNAPGCQGVIALINSPGGSPVQSGQLHRALRLLDRAHSNVPLYAVISDVGASGGYYIATAAEKIFVDPASIVGSIGVIANGFGFVDTLGKLGVERRLTTAGQHKAMLDPFSPIRAGDQAQLQAIVDGIHQQFIKAVKQGRGNRLDDDPVIFSGRVWIGEQAITLGLADNFGSVNEVARNVIGTPEIVDFSVRSNWRARLLDQLAARVISALGTGGMADYLSLN